MRRRHNNYSTFPSLETFIDVAIVLAFIYGGPFLIGYFGCKFLFNGSAELCKDWGYFFMILTPIIGYILDRVFHVFEVRE